MTRTIRSLSGVLAIVLGTAGCQTVAATVQPVCNFNALTAPPPSAAPTPVQVSTAPEALSEMPLKSVNITDVAITNKVMVQSASARRSPTGTVEVWASILNCTDYPLQIEGRSHFLDEGDAPAEEVSAWTRVFLSPRTYGVYKESSVQVARVYYYYVDLREGR